MNTYLFVAPYAVLRERISVGAPSFFEIDERERMTRIHLAALFTTKVLDACRAHDVTPWSATGVPFQMVSLMTEAERQLGIATSDTELELMNRWKRYEAQYIASQRKQYAYSTFIRMTSGAFSR